MPFGRVDRVDRKVRRLVIGQQDDKLAGGYVLAEDEARTVSHAGPREHGRKQHLHIVRREPDGTVHRMKVAGSIGDGPVAGSYGGTEGKTRRAAKLLESFRRPVPLQ